MTLTQHVQDGTTVYMSPDRRPRIRPEVVEAILGLRTPGNFEGIVNLLLADGAEKWNWTTRDHLLHVAEEMCQMNLREFDALVASVREEIQEELDQQAREDEFTDGED